MRVEFWRRVGWRGVFAMGRRPGDLLVHPRMGPNRWGLMVTYERRELTTHAPMIEKGRLLAF